MASPLKVDANAVIRNSEEQSPDGRPRTLLLAKAFGVRGWVMVSREPMNIAETGVTYLHWFLLLTYHQTRHIGFSCLPTIKLATGRVRPTGGHLISDL